MTENLWALREQKKLSVAALANRAGLPIGIIVEYESGQRSVDPRHLGRLARALYVEEAEIRLHSDPRPEPRREEVRAGPRDSAPAAAGMPAPRPARPARERVPRPKPAPKPPAPARPSQIAHIENLLQRVGLRPHRAGERARQAARPDRSPGRHAADQSPADPTGSDQPDQPAPCLPARVRRPVRGSLSGGCPARRLFAQFHDV